MSTFMERFVTEFREHMNETAIESEFNKKLSKLIKEYKKVKNRYIIIKKNAEDSFLVLVDMNETTRTTASLNNGNLRYIQVMEWGKDLTGKNDVTVHSVKFIDRLLDAIKEKNFIDK